MDIKTILKKYLVFVFGLYFLAAGIVLIIHSALGTTPISSSKLCVKPQQPSFFRDLYLYRKRIADTRTVLVNPRDEKVVKTKYLSCCKFHFRSYFNIHRFQYVTRWRPASIQLYNVDCAVTVGLSHPVYWCRIRNQTPGCDDECRRIRQLRRPPLQ